MVSVKVLLGAAAVALLGTAARAADLPPIMPIMKAPIVEEFGGWYLRGDIGMSNQRLKRLDNILFASATSFQWLDKGGFDSAPFFGIGVGYQFNSWLRVDVTGEYRGKASFHALDSFSNAGTPNTNDYTGSKSEWVLLANAYADLGTWWCMTPFVGVGIGVAYNRIDHFRDTNVIAGGGGWADTGTKTNFAWALHAGVAYKVNPAFTVELAYRYLNLGDARTADAINLDGTNVTPNNPFTFQSITSHDLKLGMRWMLQPEVMPPPMLPPLIRKG
jgi:opacity protein-like surface antigen